MKSINIKECVFTFFLLNMITLSFCYGQENKQSQDTVIIKAHQSNDPTLPYFHGLDTTFITKRRTPEEKENLFKKLTDSNLGKTKAELTQKKYWDVLQYDKINLPLKIGTIENQDHFSSFLNEKGLRFLDLPIYMPNQGWRIPPHLEQFQEIIEKVVSSERLLNPDFENDHYVYITVDQGLVKPHTSQRRAGWHGDSYRKIESRNQNVKIPIDHVYVVADCCPTLFVPGPFSFNGVDPSDIDQVLKLFLKVAEKQEVVTYPNYTILRLDPFCVHDAGINNTDQTLQRTFVKISISQSKYCKLGNAHNQLFIYDWPLLPRHGVPYTSDAIKASAHRKDRDDFQEVNIRQIDFLKSTSELPWTASKIHCIVRSQPVHAQKAVPLELLQTRSDDFLVTITAAQAGDWKVTSLGGYQVFINDMIFQNLYKPDPDRPDYYLPKQEIRKAVELTKDVRFYTPTGVLEYASKGNYIIYLNSEDIYTVPKNVFDEKYKIIE